MKLFKFILLSFLIFSSAVYANIDSSKLKELATTDREPRQHTTYLSKDGKVRYSVYDVHLDDGTVEMRTKKSYLPAVTDGINRDKTSKFRIPPNAKKMAKWFAKGANHAIFLSMIIDVLGDGVDYVLDEKNNSIQYKNNKYDCSLGNKKFSSLEAVNKYHCEVLNKQEARGTRTNDNYLYYSDCSNTYTVFHCAVLQQETKVMNDEEFAQAVIELAKADNAKAKKVVLDVAKQAVSDGDYDKEIQKAVDELNADETTDDTQDNQDNTSDSSNASSSDSTNTDSQDDTQATPNTSNPQTDNNGDKEKDKSDLPGFCDWATKVCEFIDWVQNDNVEKDKDTELDVDNKDIDIDSVANRQYFSFSKQCPQNPSFNVAFPFNINFSIEFPLHIICQAFIIFKPVVILFSYIKALSIVGRDL